DIGATGRGTGRRRTPGERGQLRRRPDRQIRPDKTVPKPTLQSDALTIVAFNRAMAEHSHSLKAFAARMLGDELAGEDIAQDAFLAYYRHMHDVPENAVRPWLFRVARNLCLDQLRRRKFKLRLFRDIQKDDEFELVPCDPKGQRPDEDAHTAEAQQAIEAAIEGLPQKFREAFVLC